MDAPEQTRRFPRTLLLVVGGVLLLLVGWLAWNQWHAVAPARELAAARERWQARPFEHYRMVMTVSRPLYPGAPCWQDLEVRGDEIVVMPQTQRRACYEEPQTVDDLFQSIEKGEPYIHGPSMYRSAFLFGCKDTTDVTISYHPDLGYPEHIISRYRTHIDWFSDEAWHSIWHYHQPPAQCGRFANGGERRIVVQTLTPLP